MYSPIFKVQDSLYLARFSAKGYIENKSVMTGYTTPRYALLNQQGDSIRGYNPYPDAMLRDNSAKKEWCYVWSPEMLYMSADALSYDERKLIMGMRVIGQINILDLSTGNLIGLRQPKTLDFITLEKEYNIDPPMEYMYVVTGKDCFLALYNGKDKLLSARNFSADIIHVFDYDGKPIKKITLDRKILSMTFEPTRKLLYGITEYEGVYKYDLSSIL